MHADCLPYILSYTCIFTKANNKNTEKKNKGKKHKMKLTVLSSLSRLFGTPLPIN